MRQPMQNKLIGIFYSKMTAAIASRMTLTSSIPV